MATLLLCAAAARAQGLNDPTRPPASLLAPSTSGAVAAPSAPQLQSILIARHPGGRNVAVIDGVMLRRGDRFQGYVLERMSDTEVVLANAKGRQVLKLYPSVPAASTAAAPTAIPR